jgi:hypothetical protein
MVRVVGQRRVQMKEHIPQRAIADAIRPQTAAQ